MGLQDRHQAHPQRPDRPLSICESKPYDIIDFLDGTLQERGSEVRSVRSRSDDPQGNGFLWGVMQRVAASLRPIVTFAKVRFAYSAVVFGVRYLGLDRHGDLPK